MASLGFRLNSAVLLAFCSSTLIHPATAEDQKTPIDPCPPAYLASIKPMDAALCSILTEPWFDATDRALCRDGVADQQKVYAQALQQCAQDRQRLLQNSKPTASPETADGNALFVAAEPPKVAETLHLLVHFGEMFDEFFGGLPYGVGFPGLPGLGLLIASIGAVPEPPVNYHPFVPPVHGPWAPIPPMPRPPEASQSAPVPNGLTMLNPSPKNSDGSDLFVTVNPRDVVVVDPSDGSAVFEPADQPGVATFRIPSGTVFLTPTSRDWSQDGIAIFSPLTPIPLTDDGSSAGSAGAAPTQQSFISQPTRRNWGGALLQGLQMGLSIYNGVQATKQAARGTGIVPPAAGTGSVQAARTGATGGSAAATKPSPTGTAAVAKPAPTVTAPAMCPNPAAIFNPHGVTVNGPNVTSSNTPSTYVPLLIPCAK